MCGRAKEDALFVGSLTSLQLPSVSRVCYAKGICCHAETEAADQTFYLTQSQYTDTGPTCPGADPVTPGAGRVATGVSMFRHWYDSTRNNLHDVIGN